MRKLTFKLIILLSPFVLFAGIVYFIDPYNYWGDSKFIDSDIKIKIAKPLNDPLWNLLKYRNIKYENILIGDSRMEAIYSQRVSQLSNTNYYNLAFGGANANEILKTLEYLIDKYNLKNIIIGLNLDQYNLYNNRERISGILKLIDNPFLYITNTNVLEASYLLLRNKLFRKEEFIKTTPVINKKEFWDYQINVTGKRYFSNYVYPHEYSDNFMKIKSKCRVKNINIKILILPNHADLNNLMDKFSIREYENTLINDMKNIGDVYDFNFDNILTTNKDNFNDPFHCNQKVIDKIIDVVFCADTTGINSLYKIYKEN